MSLHPLQDPGSPPAIDVAVGHRSFKGHWVAEGLMLANLPFEARHVEALAGEGIDLVLNMCEDREYWPGQRDAVEAAYRSAGLEENRDLRLVDLEDHPLELFDTAVGIIEGAKNDRRNTMVHCRGGIERSATIAAAALVARDGLTGSEAIARIQSIAPQAWPLPGQRASLEEWAAGR